jgi:hypothetical protein
VCEYMYVTHWKVCFDDMKLENGFVMNMEMMGFVVMRCLNQCHHLIYIFFKYFFDKGTRGLWNPAEAHKAYRTR